ncbi:TPA: succinate dehydrogenase, cytochrome b556 subunit [Enterobacter kobei]
MNKKRPVNLDIRTIQLPLTALTSILHRISGIMLFIFLGLILYMLSKSLESEKGFNEVKEIFSSPFGKVSFWLVYSSFIYHLVAGIRHLVMDVGVGHTLKGSNRASTIVLGRVRISTLRNENETFSQLNSITYIGVFLRLVTYSHLP